MQNNIVWSAKQRYPKYENVPDDELTLLYAKSNPEFLNDDAGFKADYERITRASSPVVAQPAPEAGVMESVVRRLGAGYAGVGTAGWKGVEYIQRALGAEEAAQSSKETADFAEQFAEEQRAKSGKTGVAKYAGALAEMVPGVLSTVAALPLGPAALVAAGGIYGGLSTLSPAEQGFYKQNIEAGMSEEEALSDARPKAAAVGAASGILTGLITRGFNRMGMGGLEATLAKSQAGAATAKAAAGGVLSAADDAAIALSRQAALAEAKAVVAQSLPKAFIQGARHEALEEVTDQIGQAALERMTFNPELTLEQAIESVKMAAIGGGVLGGGVSAMFQPTRVAQSQALINSENLRAAEVERAAGVKRATEAAQGASAALDTTPPVETPSQFDAGAPAVISREAVQAEIDNKKNADRLTTADANLVTANETAATANERAKTATEAHAAAVALRQLTVPPTPAQASVAAEAKLDDSMLEPPSVSPAIPPSATTTRDTSKPEQMTPDEYSHRGLPYQAEDDVQLETMVARRKDPSLPYEETMAKIRAEKVRLYHSSEIEASTRKARRPVSAAAVGAYGIKLPEGYVKRGELYVFQPRERDGGQGEVVRNPKTVRRNPDGFTARDTSKPEQMTPEEYVSPRSTWDRDFEDTVQEETIKRRLGKNKNLPYRETRDKVRQEFKEWYHRHNIEMSVGGRMRIPVSAAAVDAYGIKLPEGYVKRGELYVFQQVATPSIPFLSTPAVEQAAAAASKPQTTAATPAMQDVIDAKKPKEEKKAISELNKKIHALAVEVKAANYAAMQAKGRAAKSALLAEKARERWNKSNTHLKKVSPAPAAVAPAVAPAAPAAPAAAPAVAAATPAPPAPPTPKAPAPPSSTPPVPPTGTNVFDAENLTNSPVTAFDKIKAALVARFAPLDALQRKLAEKIDGYKIKFRLARMYEAVAGSRGKAEARFTELSEKINPLILGVEKQFSEMVFFFAAGTRIANGIDTFNNGRKMAAGDVTANINKLRRDLIQSGHWAGVRQSLQIYKQSMDTMLDVMLQSQLISRSEYDKLKVPNAFYAPFIKTEVGQRGGWGGTTNGEGGYSPMASAKGQQDPDARLRPALDAALEYFTKVHSRADINAANLHLYELAKLANAPELARVTDTALIREDAISVLVEGELKQIAVHKDVAAAVAAIPRSANALNSIATAMAGLVRFGATTASIPFQFRNFFFSDMPNAAIVSEAGVRNPVDAINFIFAVWKAFKLAYAGNMGSGATPEGYLAAQKAGVLGGGLQASFEAVGGGRSGRKGDILNTIGDIGRVIEETTKLTVFQRLLDKAGKKSVSDMTTEDAMNLIAEVRNYGGSPDFLRGGSLVKSANLTTLLIFVPATIQGNASTIGRLLDNVKSGATKHERDTARAALTRAGLFIGTATLAAYALNHLTKEYEDDFESISANERRDYWMIPTDTFVTSATGEKVRKYYRIQKRGITKLIASSIEDGMAYAKVTDQKHFNEMLAGASESILPFSVKGDTAEKKMMSAAASLNPLLKVFAEYMTGKDFYAGKQTIPRFMELASVNRQFGERTNENVKVMAGYLGMSPLKLRQVLNGLTGGLSGKVLPDKPIEGDEGGVANILGLVRSGYKEDADKVLIEEATQHAADRSVDRRLEAVQFVGQREGVKLSDIYQEAEKKYGATRPDLVQKIEEILRGKQRGVTREDEVLIRLPPEERSDIIMQRLSRIPKDRQKDYIIGLYRKGVATEATLVQLRRRGMPF